MKKSVIFCMCLAVIALFTACNKNEGVYNPSKKIQKIYSVDDQGAKEIIEVWNWDGKVLTSIFDAVHEYTSTFSYDSKNRLSAIDVPGSHAEFIYDGKYLQKMVTTDEAGEVFETTEFEHENGKISKITMIYDDHVIAGKMSKVNPLRFMIPNAFPVVEKAMKKYSKDVKGTQIVIKLNWKGDNVSVLEMEIPIMGMTYTETIEFTFDNMNNPMYGSFASMVSEVGGEIFFLNKNNPLTMRTLYNGQEFESVEYSYEYDGKYPTKMSTMYVDDEGAAYAESVIYEY